LKKNLVLTGMMGVGKSTIGKRLARKLKLKFIDVDKIIEKKEKKTISEIFEIRGEEYFRKIEQKITLGVFKKNNSVIALGGGAFINPTIRKESENSSVSFWLDLKLNSLFFRLKNLKKRPLLKQENLKETINKIYSERKKIYNKSDFRIRCSSMSVNQIVSKIIKLYEHK